MLPFFYYSFFFMCVSVRIMIIIEIILRKKKYLCYMPNATRHTMAIFRIFDSNNSQYTKIKVLFFRHKYLFISIPLFLFSLCVFAHFITGMSKEYIFVHRCKSVCTLRINSVVIFYSLCLNNLGICKRFTMDFFLSRM